MAGLLLKDFICLKRQAKTIIIFFILFLVTSITQSGFSYMNGIIIVLSSTLVMNTFAYDEMSKWDIFALSLPVTKRQVVLSKYILTTILSFFGILLTALIMIVKGEATTQSLLGLGMTSESAIIMVSIILPLLYKYGSQKSRIMLFIIIFVPAFLVVGISQIGIKTPSDDFFMKLMNVTPFAVALIFVISYYISCRIFENKEI